MMASLPEPQGKTFSASPPLFCLFTAPLAEGSQTCPRKTAAVEARGHGAVPQRDDLLSDPRIAFVAGGRELCPRGGVFFFFFLRLPADLNWDKVELLSLRSGEAAGLQSGPPLLY